MPLVRRGIAGHFTSSASRPLYLDGRRLAHAILNLVLQLPRIIELAPLGIPAEHQIFDHCQQLNHGDVELFYNADALGVFKLVFNCYNNALPTL